MKRVFASLVLLAMGLTACGTPSGDTNSTLDGTTSSDIVSEVVSEKTSSVEEVPVIREIDGVKYYDAKAAGADKEPVYEDLNLGIKIGDHSKYFPEDAEGYYLDDMLFLVDEETFERILSKPCKGPGSIRWKDYNDSLSWHGNDSLYNDWFDGILPVDKMNDPLYVFMCKPSEAPTVMNRINASNLSPAEDKFVTVCAIGAIYNNSEKPIPDDAEFTICLGRTTVIFYTEEKGWHMAQEAYSPSRPSSIYYLPWELQTSIGVMKLSNDRIKMVDGHWEIKMTGAELNGGDGRDKGATGSVLHFWSEQLRIQNAGDIKAIATSYECWIKEAQWADYVVAAVGADWRDGDKQGQEIYQAYSGHNYKISTEPRVIFGHTAGPENYDKIMDTEKVQKLLGLK